MADLLRTNFDHKILKVRAFWSVFYWNPKVNFYVNYYYKRINSFLFQN